MRRLTRTERILLWGVPTVLGTYLVVLAVRGNGYNPLLDGWLALACDWAAVALVWAACARVRPRRLDVVCAALALTALALGDTANRVLPTGVGPTWLPSPADLCYLAFYVCMMGALAVLARRSLRGQAWSVLLSSAVGGLGATSLLAVVLSPTIEAALNGPFSAAVLMRIAFPVFDLLLVATLAGIASAPVTVLGRHGLLLVAGLVMFAAADVMHALRLPEDAVPLGVALYAGWAVGFALITGWVLVTVRLRRRSPRAALGSTTATTAVAVPVVATAAGLGVLLLASQTHVSLLAVCLAGSTLALATIPLAFRQRILHSLSRTDELTGLPNRRALAMDVSARLRAPDARPSALLVLDIDRFKEVNDSLGHEAGDRLLSRIGERLAGVLRSGDLLARLGGDEFAVHLHHADAQRATAMANRLRAVTARPLVVDGLSLELGLSIGIALAPEHGSDLGGLLRNADIAMYAAKTTRMGQRIYSTGDEKNDAMRLRTLQELRVALAEDQLVLHYQPKVNLRTNSVHGVEALVRWNHPTRGLLHPGEFLDVAEQGGLMRTLTSTVLRLALDQAALWHARALPLTIAVNLSSRSLADFRLAGIVVDMLESRGLPGSALMLEVTEEFLLVDRDRARAILVRLRDAGVMIAVDDFGTGYSSLAYLRDLPIDELKLDQSFVIPMLDDDRASALVASSIHLGHSLGLRIVAEGVETAEVLEQLTRFDCDVAQGYFLSRPVPAAALEAWLVDRAAATGTAVPLAVAGIE
ncbi:EAL domain-containing protein [Cryobacterium sp. SO2]|uniref:putative bifunctional diguanylate cyclase/phosphodiesterase n=1 Tax=Cryobacterium sp. SO2 TaxID=1897060 RepID=UPI00223E7CD9|nr:EAL domain-containing protein [Cryobacterium sp. SO2]WEO76298.1 EAL domain-containing protein [Cryobacterium sp. SO2]